MASEYKPYIAINLEKADRLDIVKRLKPGDHYSFFVKELIKAEDRIDETKLVHLVTGDMFSKWYATNESGRVFQITEIYQTGDSWVYETRFIGFSILQDNGRGQLRSYLSRTADGLSPIEA